MMFRCLIFLMWMGAVMADDTVKYNFSVTNAAQHLGRVEMVLPATEAQQVTVKLPVWRSGRYEVLNLSKNITDFSAKDESGHDLTWSKSNKNTWVINNPGLGVVTVSYVVYANMLSYRVAHIDETHAFLDASGVFMFAPDLRQSPLTVTLEVPAHWRSRSGMSSPSNHVFVADNYDQLVDSPIESGVHEFLAFAVNNRQYEIIIWGEGNHDISDLKQNIEKIDQVAADLWGDFPFQRYVFIYHVAEGVRGATEHVNSTVIQSHRFQFDPRSDYLKILATTAHEFIHTWNVKSYRPSGIAPYDYSDENYSKLFWMVEGSTSYYDDLFLLRAGIYKPKEYLKKLAGDIHGHLGKPGREVNSVAMSSFDTWLNNDPHFTLNNRVSIYLEGALKSWALDQAIREKTADKYSYDDVQRRLYGAHVNTDIGYDESDVQAILKDLTGSAMTEFWQDFVDGTKALDFDEILAYYGLQRVFDKDSEQTVWLGLETTDDSAGVAVKAVHRNGPAWQAGVTGGDVILAVDGHRVRINDWAARLKMLGLGESHELTYFRGDQIQTTRIYPIAKPNPEFSIEPLAKPSRRQQQAFTSWTGIEFNNLYE